METLLSFLNGEAFGYFLHAIEMLIAMALFGIGLKKRTYFVLRVVLTECLYLFFCVGLGILIGRVFPYGRYLVVFLLAFALYPICFNIDVWDSMFRVVAAATTQNIAYCFTGMVASLCGWDPLHIVFPLSVLQSAIYLVVQTGVYLVCRFEMKNMDVDFAQERYPLIIIAVILSIINYVIQLDRRAVTSADFYAWQIMFISFDVLLLSMLFGLSERNKLRRENVVLDQLRASEERQYELDQSAIETINIKCHDLKHQLNALRGMEGEARDRALEDVEKAVMIYDSVVQTGCKPLDVILKSKYLLCEREKIRFTYMIDGEKLSFMSAVDIYSLFGNALDNAIRATKDAEDESMRVINMTTKTRGQVLFIHIENYVAHEPTFCDGIPLTTKEDKVNHGFGIVSMRRTVESYGGVMEVSCKDHLFRLDMTIPVGGCGKPLEERMASKKIR